MELFSYLIKVMGCTAAFYLVYRILFSKLTFFTLNRWYLLSALVLSMLIPLLHINIQTTVPAPDIKPLIINTNTKTILEPADSVFIAQQPQLHTDWMLIADMAYCAIAGLLLLKLLVVLAGIVFKAIKYGKKQTGYRLIESGAPNNSSFFRYIFLDGTGLNDHEKEQVICHELVHARLGHTADNLFTEVLKAVLWFNPFVYLFSKALHQSHEFEVDRHLALQYNSKDYAGLLLKLSNPARVGISNQFSAYGLKMRIQMLFRSQSATAKKLSYLLVLPVILGLVYFVAVEHVYAFAEDTGSNKNFVLVLDAGHGGKSGANFNGIREGDIALSLAKQIKAIAEAHGIKTILTRSGNVDVPLANRTGIPGNVFVSLHVNFDPYKRPVETSGMMVITDRVGNQTQSKQLAQLFINEMKHLDGIAMNDEIYKQGIKVLRESKIPAIAFEMGYLSSKSDRAYLTNKQNQQAIANKFVDAIITYKNTIQPKANIVPSTGALHTDVKVNFISNSKFNTQNAIADTAIRVTAATRDGATMSPRKGHLNSINMQLLNDSPSDPKDKMYSNFREVRSAAVDSSIVDSKTGAIRLYKGELFTSMFNIKADYILYDLKDSLISANGNVRINASDSKKSNAKLRVIETDTLNISLKHYEARNFIKKH